MPFAKPEDLKSKTALPLIVAPMFLVSTPELALAACREGVVGSFPALNQRTSQGFEDWLVQMNTGLEKLRQDHPNDKIAPYAVNLIVHKTNPRLEEDLKLCIKHKVPVIITSLGISPELIKAVQAYGGIVLHDVTNVEHAKKAAGAGVDGIIAVAAGAGGHGGTMNPIALVNEIRQFYHGIVVLSGTLTTGQDILAAEAMGADFAYMGTRFISTAEAGADAEYKKMIVDSKSTDIVYTPAISGIPANFLRQSMEKAGFNLEQIKKDGMNGGKLKSLTDEAKAWKNIWSAGQGVGNITDTPSVHELVRRMKQEYGAALDKMDKRIQARKPPKPPVY